MAAKVCSMGRRTSELKCSWPVVNLFQVFNEFPNLLKDFSASASGYYKTDEDQ